MDNFIQLKNEIDKNNEKIFIDVTRLKDLWEEIKNNYDLNGFKFTLKWLESIEKEKKNEVSEKYEFSRRVRHE